MPSDKKVVDAIGIYHLGNDYWLYEEKATNLRQALKQIEDTFEYTKIKKLSVVNVVINIGKIKAPLKSRYTSKRITKELIENKDIPRFPGFEMKKHKFLWDKEQRNFVRYTNGLFIRMI